MGVLKRYPCSSPLRLRSTGSVEGSVGLATLAGKLVGGAVRTHVSLRIPNWPRMRAREALPPGFHLNLLPNDSQLLAAFERLIEQRKSSPDTESVDRVLKIAVCQPSL